MCKFSSKSGRVQFQILFFWGDLTWNDPYANDNDNSLLNINAAMK